STPRPWLSRWDAAELAWIGPWGDGVFGIDSGRVAYGTPLAQLASEYDFLGDVLEAAAIAGHSSAIHEGIAMTLRAFHAFVSAQSREYSLQGADGDAFGWLDAGLFRDLAILSEELAADLEEQAAQLGAAIGD